jgi:hypothetical protein
MTLETKDPIAGIEDAGERQIAEKLAEILKHYSSLCQVLAENIKPSASHVAAQLVTRQLDFYKICEIVELSIAPFRSQQQSRTDNFELHMKSIPSFLMQLVWHRKLADKSPINEKKSGMVVDAATTINPNLSDIFLEIISALSDCAPMLFELEKDDRSLSLRSNAIRIDNAFTAETGALDVKSHLDQALRKVHALSLNTVAGVAGASTTIQMKNNNLQINNEPLQVAGLKFQLRLLRQQGIRLFFFRSDPSTYALSEEALATGLADTFGFTPELVRILKPTQRLMQEFEDLLQETNSALFAINGQLGK